MVAWTHQAKADLRRIFEYIESDSPHYARKVVEEISRKPDILDDFPRLGRIVPELGDNNIRELMIYSWRIIYELDEGGVTILTIVHQRRDFEVEDYK